MSDGERILDVLRQRPGLKARAIAAATNLPRQRVNSLLHGNLSRRVRQDNRYCWHLATQGNTAPRDMPDADAQVSANAHHARLCRYYLACLAREGVGDVGVFASGKHGLQYAELPAVPAITDGVGAGFAARVVDLKRRTRPDRGATALYVGYPVRLRYLQARSGWTGFFLEPVFLFMVQDDSAEGSGSPSVDPVPTINPAVVKRLSTADSAQGLHEAIALAEELGLCGGVDEFPEFDEVAMRLTTVRPEWDWVEKIDPYDLPQHPPLSGIGQEGIYNRAVLLATERPPYTRGLETELAELSRFPSNKVEGTALGDWLDGRPGSPSSASAEDIMEVVPLNSEQRQAVRQGLTDPLTVITGPPGTGKSQVVISLVANAALRDQTVLLASRNNKAVDVVVERTNGIGARPLLIRLGKDEHRDALASYLSSLLAGRVSESDKSEFERQSRELHSTMAQLSTLDEELDDITAARNRTERLACETDHLRVELGESFAAMRDADLDTLAAGAAALGAAL